VASAIANQAPTAYDATASTTESAVLQAKVPEALDPERGAITYQLVSGVAAGRLTFNANGSYSFNPGIAFKHLVAGESNRVTFTYQAIDNKGAASAPRTVTITIKGQNDVPPPSIGQAPPSIGLTPTSTYLGNRNPGNAALDREFRVRADDMIHLLRLVRPDSTRWGGGRSSASMSMATPTPSPVRAPPTATATIWPMQGRTGSMAPLMISSAARPVM
jgi:VCBS repeat-containing protein